MKILIEIQDNKANFFLELLKSFKFIKSQKIIDDESYDPKFVRKIENGEKDISEGRGVKMSLEDLDDLCK